MRRRFKAYKITVIHTGAIASAAAWWRWDIEMDWGRSNGVGTNKIQFMLQEHGADVRKFMRALNY